MGPYQRTPKSVARAVRYSGLGVRSVGPTVGDFLDIFFSQNPMDSSNSNTCGGWSCSLMPRRRPRPQPLDLEGWGSQVGGRGEAHYGQFFSKMLLERVPTWRIIPPSRWRMAMVKKFRSLIHD